MRPTKLVCQPALRWQHQFDWLWWDKPATQAIVIAEVDKAKNLKTAACGDPELVLAASVALTAP